MFWTLVIVVCVAMKTIFLRAEKTMAITLNTWITKLHAASRQLIGFNLELTYDSYANAISDSQKTHVIVVVFLFRHKALLLYAIYLHYREITLNKLSN